MINTLPISPKGINIPDMPPEVLSDVQNAQKYDHLGNALRNVMNTSDLPLNDRLHATALAMQLYCEQFNGILYYRDPHTEHYRIYVPAALRRELLHLHHGGKVGGHFGFLKVLRWLKDRYYWPKMCNDIHMHCRNCAVCAARSAHRL